VKTSLKKPIERLGKKGEKVKGNRTRNQMI